MSTLEEYRERIIQRERADMLATIAALEAELQTAEAENERLKVDVLRSDKAVEDAAAALEVCDVTLATWAETLAKHAGFEHRTSKAMDELLTWMEEQQGDLDDEVERLKCCGNCYSYSSSLYDCNDDVDDELDDLAAGCDCYDSCHFTPSRWEPVEAPPGPEVVPARGPLFGDGVWERRQDNPPGLGLINDVVPPDRVSDE